MKVRRVTVEIEVPWHFHQLALLAVISAGLDVGCKDMPHQEQVVKVEESPNTSLGGKT